MVRTVERLGTEGDVGDDVVVGSVGGGDGGGGGVCSRQVVFGRPEREDVRDGSLVAILKIGCALCKSNNKQTNKQANKQKSFQKARSDFTKLQPQPQSQSSTPPLP